MTDVLPHDVDPLLIEKKKSKKSDKSSKSSKTSKTHKESKKTKKSKKTEVVLGVTEGKVEKKKRAYKKIDVDRLRSCHARNAIFELKGNAHLGKDATKLLSLGAETYIENLVKEASIISNSHEKRKNDITPEDLIKAASVVPPIFPQHLFQGFVESEKKERKSKKSKKTAEQVEQVEQTQQ